MSHVRAALDAKVSLLVDLGEHLPDPEEMAEAMAAGLPDAATPHPYAELGPFYSSKGVMRLLRIRSKQALDDRRRRGTVLGAKTAEDAWVYPSFQFDVRRHQVRQSLVPVLAALKDAPRWGAALWLSTPHPELGEHLPREAANAHTDLVARLAQQYVHAVTAE
jgi:hypothetical protein